MDDEAKPEPVQPFVFISYTNADQAWATWIAAVLEDAGLMDSDLKGADFQGRRSTRRKSGGCG